MHHSYLWYAVCLECCALLECHLALELHPLHILCSLKLESLQLFRCWLLYEHRNPLRRLLSELELLKLKLLELLGLELLYSYLWLELDLLLLLL